MLIDAENIVSRFSENIEWASKVYIATAWATANDGLSKLQEKAENLEIQIVVGLWGNITDPQALRTLDRISELRVIENNRLFHPKVYIFRNSEKSVAWIGSANFTSGGFGTNEELLFETHDTKDIEEWFKRIWNQCDHLNAKIIDEYAKQRKNNPPSRPHRPKISSRVFEDKPLVLLKDVTSWKGYLNALKQCDQWWISKFDGKYSVLGETSCWEETIRELRVVVKGDWNKLADSEKKSLLGLRGVDEKWALLGRMRPAALNTVFSDQDNRDTIKNALSNVIAADDKDFPEVAVEAYEEIINIRGIGKGIATRLLALARPDCLVSFNSKSIGGLEEYLGIRFSRDKLLPEEYRSLLEHLYEKPWFKTPCPEVPWERSIWLMQAALIDCFVYSGDGPD